MKQITWKATIYATAEVPDDCPNTPKEAQEYCDKHGWCADSYDFDTLDEEGIIFIDAVNEDGNIGLALYE